MEVSIWFPLPTRLDNGRQSSASKRVTRHALLSLARTLAPIHLYFLPSVTNAQLFSNTDSSLFLSNVHSLSLCLSWTNSARLRCQRDVPSCSWTGERQNISLLWSVTARRGCKSTEHLSMALRCPALNNARCVRGGARAIALASFSLAFAHPPRSRGRRRRRRRRRLSVPVDACRG